MTRKVKYTGCFLVKHRNATDVRRRASKPDWVREMEGGDKRTTQSVLSCGTPDV